MTSPTSPLPDAAWPGACDCHVHFFEDHYPLAATALFKPPHSPVADYRAVQARLGLQRVVVVQANGYGFDNRCTLDGMRQLGADARGVAVIRPDIPQAELQALHDVGMRGVRFMMLPGGALTWDALEPVAERIAPLGWNINLQLDGRTLAQHEARLQALPCRLVIDHTGKFLEPVATGDESFQVLCRLLAAGRCWVKIAAPYETSKSGPPAYGDVAVLARELIARFPARCLWASNWPHLNIRPEPSSSDMLRWFLDLAGNAATARQILVDNPAALYGF